MLSVRIGPCITPGRLPWNHGSNHPSKDPWPRLLLCHDGQNRRACLSNCILAAAQLGVLKFHVHVISIFILILFHFISCHSFIYGFIPVLVTSLHHSLSFTSLRHSLVHTFIGSWIETFFHWFVHAFMGSSLRSWFIRWLTYSFMPLISFHVVLFHWHLSKHLLSPWCASHLQTIGFL